MNTRKRSATRKRRRRDEDDEDDEAQDEIKLLQIFGFKEGKPTLDIMEQLSESHRCDRQVSRDVIVLRMCKHILEWLLNKLQAMSEPDILLAVSNLGRDVRGDLEAKDANYPSPRPLDFTLTQKTFKTRQYALFRFIKIYLNLPYAPGHAEVLRAVELTENLCDQWKRKHGLENLLKAMKLLAEDEEGPDGKQFKSACRTMIVVMEAWVRAKEEACLSITQSLLFSTKKEQEGVDSTIESRASATQVDVSPVAQLTLNLANLLAFAKYAIVYRMIEELELHERDVRRFEELRSRDLLASDEARNLQSKIGNSPDLLKMYQENYKLAQVPALLCRQIAVARKISERNTRKKKRLGR